MNVTSKATSNGGLKGLAKRLRETAAGVDRDSAGRAGAAILAAVVHGEMAGHVKSGRMLGTAEIVAVAGGHGEALQLKLDYDATVRTKRFRGFVLVGPRKGDTKAAKKGGGPAIYFRMGGTGHGGPRLNFAKGFTKVQIAAARGAYVRVLLAKLGGK